MKTKYAWMMIAVAAMAGFSSCRQDEPAAVEQPTRQQVELGFSATLGNVDLELAETRAPLQQASGYFATSQRVGVFVFEDATSPVAIYNDGKCIDTTVAAENGAGFSRLNITSGTTYYWPYSGNNLKVYAWYPLGASGKGGVTANMVNSATPTFTVAADQTTDMKLNDLMFAKNEAAELEPGMVSCNVPLQFIHKLMQVHVTLTAGAGLTASNLTGAKISIGTAESSIKSSVQITNLLTGAITVQDTKLGAPLQVCGSYNASTDNAYAVIPPQNLSGLTLTVQLSNGGILKAALGSNTFASNSVLTINVTVSLTKLTLSSSIAEWGVPTSNAVKAGNAYVGGTDATVAKLAEWIEKGKDCSDYLYWGVDEDGAIEYGYVTINGVNCLPLSGKPVVGIIAYLGTETAETGYQHGLVLSVKDANQGNTCAWRTSNTLSNPQYSNNISTQLGYKESGSSLSSGRNTSNWPAFRSAMLNDIFTAGVVVPAPSGTTGWFLPSIYQWNKIVNGLTGTTTDFTTSANNSLAPTAYNSIITKAGGTPLSAYCYWTSSERSSNSAWSYNTAKIGFSLNIPGGAGWGGTQFQHDASKTRNEGYVRGVFAF